MEYWIIDAEQQTMTVHHRHDGKWNVRMVTAGELLTTSLLPGFEFDLTRVFEAANE